MEIKNTKTRKEIMSFLTTTATADSEQSVQENLLKLFNPASTREDMGKIYNDVLGYNPINHFDREELRDLLDMALNAIADEHPDTADEIGKHRGVIVDRALESFEADRTETFRTILAREAQSYAGDVSVFHYFGVDEPDYAAIEEDDDDDVDPIGDYEGDGSLDGEDEDLNNPTMLDDDDNFQYGDNDESADEEEEESCADVRCPRRALVKRSALSSDTSRTGWRWPIVMRTARQFMPEAWTR